MSTARRCGRLNLTSKVWGTAVLWVLVPGLLWGQSQRPPVMVSDPVEPFIIQVDLRQLPVLPIWRPGDPIREVPKLRNGPPVDFAEPLGKPDPLLPMQAQAPSQLDRGIDNTIINVGAQGFTGSHPPDTVGDVGTQYYIQAVNAGSTQYTVYNKGDGSVAAGPFSLDDLSSGGSCSSGDGDPMVVFDQLANRWILSEFPLDDSANLCVYISQTADPIAGGWFEYTFPTVAFPDYPKFGVWHDAYYVTSNEDLPRIYAFDRAQMLVGGAATGQGFELTDLAGFVFEAATPADLSGFEEPPAAAPGLVMRHRDDEAHNGGANDPARDFLELYEVTVDFAVPGNSNLNGPINIPVTEFDSALCGLGSTGCFPMPGSAIALDPLSEVIMFRLAYRNFLSHQSLVGNFVTDADGNDLGGIRWFELRKTGAGPWTLFQEGTYAPDGVNRWMAGIAMDVSGNIAMAYNVTDDSSVFPGIRYTGRLVDDPAGSMPQGEFTIVNGTAANGLNRYGDYSGMSVDPVDDCTFWFTGMYNVAANWSTRIASFRFDDCGCSPPDAPVSLNAVPNGDNRIDLSWPAVAGAESYQVYRTSGACPQLFYDLVASGVGVTSYSDTTVSGGTTYAYVVRAFDADEDCLSVFSTCADATATGLCLLPPVFEGLQTLTNPQAQECSLELSWQAADTSCAGGVRYNVYRSQTPGFTPGPGNLLASCVDALAYSDTSAEFGVTYYYAVRAEDQTGLGSGPCAGGHEDDNQVILSAQATGPDTIFFDDDLEGGDGAWVVETLPADQGTAPWSLQKNETVNWFCSDQSRVKDQVVRFANAIALGSAARLEFRHTFETEANRDGGVLEYSTDGGTNWFDILEGNGGTVPANPNRFTSNGYGTALDATDNPLSGRPAWHGSSPFVDVGVDLGDMAGHNLLLRWRMGCDGLTSAQGWWLDNILVIAGSSCGECDQVESLLPLWPEITVLELVDCVGTP